jgi:acyl-CoA synthetase (AMP-forming)/AMP-acid ligase II
MASPHELIAFCDGQLARYKMPKSVVFVDALPRNTLGKINRGELKQKYSG